MTAINFPDSPSNGDTHVVGGVTYTYDSTETKWKTTINSNAFLPLTGGTVSGNIVLDGELQHSGDTDTKLHFDTDTIKFDTAGSERFRVGSAGQLGIGGATYGTSGQVLTSQGSGSAPQWVSAGYTSLGRTNTTSGSSYTVTGIPTTARHVVIVFSNISVNNTTVPHLTLQVGNGSLNSSDYYWSIAYGTNSQALNATSSVRVFHTDYNSPSNSYFGVIEIYPTDPYIIGYIQATVQGNQPSRGSFKWAGSSAIDRVNLSTASTFDAGHFVVYYI